MELTQADIRGLTGEQVRGMVEIALALKPGVERLRINSDTTFRITDAGTDVLCAIANLTGMIEDICYDYCEQSSVAVIMRAYAGPVWTAALIAELDFDKLTEPIDLFRVCGMADQTERMPAKEARKLIGKHCRWLKERDVSEAEINDTIEELANITGRNPRKLKRHEATGLPGENALVEWLTRLTYSTYLRTVCLKIADRLVKQSPWNDLYRIALVKHSVANENGAYAQAAQDRLDRERVSPADYAFYALGRFPPHYVEYVAKREMMQSFLGQVFVKMKETN